MQCSSGLQPLRYEPWGAGGGGGGWGAGPTHNPQTPPSIHLTGRCVTNCTWHISAPPPPPPPHDRIPGTDQAVRGGRHGQKLHSGFPPRQVDARGCADARSSTDACLS